MVTFYKNTICVESNKLQTLFLWSKPLKGATKITTKLDLYWQGPKIAWKGKEKMEKGGRQIKALRFLA